MAVNGYRILALDVDGTLLDAEGTLRPSTASAVAKAARAGLRPVLCTGRRYRRALPVATQLGLDAPLVCNSGSLVKEPSDHATLWRADFEPGLLAEVLALFDLHGELAVSFTDRGPDDLDFVVSRGSTGRPAFDDYLAQNLGHVEIDPRWADLDRLASDRHYHLCAIGEKPAMLAFEEVLHAALPGRIRTFVQRSPRYLGTMCEVIHPEASKWSAVLHLAELWGVDPAEIVAVGDDMNDLPMIAGAGLGVAMGHAPRDVLAVADVVAADQDQDGLARFLVDFLK